MIAKNKLALITLFLFPCIGVTEETLSIEQFLRTQSSMTYQLERLENSLTVIVLSSKMEDGQYFERVVSLNLENKPVIVGVSSASIDSPYFIDLLKSSDTTPLGKSLFKKDSDVKRDVEMQIEEVNLDMISDKVVKSYIIDLGYTDRDVLYRRTSIFRKDKQHMQVMEYVLPSIQDFL